jgi:predicted dehydrogenase
MGRRYIEGCASERIVALCDVDHGFAAPVFRKYPDARVYRNFRQMFDKEEKNIDAVIVATPDHNHAMVLMEAIRRRKHVYGAKPLTHNLFEARTVREAAHAAGVATQMSVQSSASEEARSTAEILLSGAIGPVQEVHVWCDHPLYPAGLERPREQPPVPEGLDWDLWLGPAPYRPYHKIYHPWTWRSWWDFGTGTVGDMACHAFHVFYEALELGAPMSVDGVRTKMHGGYFQMHPDGKETLPPLVKTPETESYSSVVTWDFPERGSHPRLRLHWYDGGMRPSSAGRARRR